MSAEADTHFDVIIIGAGLSGLTCADELLRANPTLKVLILEGAERVGGRTKTIEVDHTPERPKVKLDAGGMWLSPTHENMLANCKRFGVETVPQYYFEGKHVLTRGDVAWKSYKGEIPPYSIVSLLEIQFLILNKVKALALQVPLEEPWKCAKAKEWDSQSVHAYMSKSLWTSAAIEVVDLVCQAVLGSRSSQISMLFFLWLVHACEGIKMLTDATGGAQDRTMKGGAQQISEKLCEAATSAGATILFNSCVARVEGTSSSTGHSMRVILNNGTSFSSRFVVSAGLVSQFLKTCAFTQPLPGPVERFAHATYRGAYAKAVLLYETAWWRELGFSGFVTNTQPSVDACAVFGYDYTGAETALVFFITGDVSAEVGAMSEEKRQESILKSAERFFPDHKDKVRKFVSYHDEFWQNNAFSKGGPMTSYGPGFFETYSAARLFRNPMKLGEKASPSLFFAGTDVSVRWTGYMEGACIRGKEVAAELLKEVQKPAVSVQLDQDARWCS